MLTGGEKDDKPEGAEEGGNKKSRRHGRKRRISPIEWDRKSRESRSASAESRGSEPGDDDGSESKRSRMASSVGSSKSEPQLYSQRPVKR